MRFLRKTKEFSLTPSPPEPPSFWTLRDKYGGYMELYEAFVEGKLDSFERETFEERYLTLAMMTTYLAYKVAKVAKL
jgi:hypothetical protein